MGNSLIEKLSTDQLTRQPSMLFANLFFSFEQPFSLPFPKIAWIQRSLSIKMLEEKMKMDSLKIEKSEISGQFLMKTPKYSINQ